MTSTRTLSPADAAKAITGSSDLQRLSGLLVDGILSFKGNTDLRALPDGLTVGVLDISGCTALTALPRGLRARRIIADDCTALAALPDGLRCHEVTARRSGLTSLPADLAVEYRLDLSECRRLTRLPAGLKVGSLIVRECTALVALPEGLDVYYLDIEGCTRLETLPERAALRIGRLNARGCTRLRALPDWLTELTQLDISGCARLDSLPAALHISSWLDLADTGIGWLPAAARGAQLRWRGVPVDARIIFHPHTITAAEVLAERNAERRRVLLERMGYERFLAEAEARTLATDRDPGGERRLLRVDLGSDEPLVCLSVFCPSTGRQYLIRVPPAMESCHQAAAWIAGYDNPADYVPLQET